MSILHDLCDNLLVVIPETDEHFAAVEKVHGAIAFMLLPEVEGERWLQLSEALRGFTPGTEIGRQVIGLFNLASSKRDKLFRMAQ